MTTPANLSEQILALPTGAGAVGSAGQTFQTDPYTGTGRFEIPIESRPGHAGLAPALSLVYSTHGGDGIAGLGWSLNLARVERRTDRGLPAFDNQLDTFTLQGDELLPVGGDAYRLRIDERFARIRHVIEAGRDFWVVTERDGTRVFYGLDPDHRLHDGGGRISAWYVSKKQDASGNEVRFTYTRDATTRDVRLMEVSWAGCYRLRFLYEPRPDPILTVRPGFPHERRHRLTTIEVQAARTSTGTFATYRAYGLEYSVSRWTGRSLLTAVTVTGFGPDGASRSLPPLVFGYVDPDLADRRWREVGGAIPGRSLADPNLTLARQSGSGLPDLLETTPTGHWLRENVGDARFDTPRRVPSPAGVLLGDRGSFISDLSGDGFGDLVVDGGVRAYRGVPGGGWGAPYESAKAPSVELEAPDVRIVDLNGDGVPDALRVGVGGWTVFLNSGEGRWLPGARVEGLVPPLRLEDPRVQLTDLSGDGIPDLVFVEQRRVTVWPGLGFGRFGTPYDLTNAPDFGPTFDPRGVRWVDLTGSGQADLLYVRAGTAVAYLNQAGIALSAPALLGQTPQSSCGHVEPVDLLGTGADGLLFTDCQGGLGGWRFLEIFPAGSPDLLTTIDNGLGARTTVTYTSSAAHWVTDRRAGRPRRAAMPSPQRVVETVTTLDTVTKNRLGIRYRYHHGVYDGDEREFRGFACVEQIDQEASPGEPDPLPSVLVRRWYHTGLPLELSDEFAPLPGGALVDDVPALPWALRSLRGRLRREETYALDGNPKPYVVSETAYRVFPVERQPGTSRHTFSPLAVRQRITHSERGAEPRVAETVTTYDLESGSGYGLPVETRECGHGRPGSFTTAHELAQTVPLERSTRYEYVRRDEPDRDYFAAYRPHYLVDKSCRIERFGTVDGVVTLLGRELLYYDGADYQGLGFPGTGTAAGVERGRLSARLVLAFDDALLDAVYGSASAAARGALRERGHYVELAGSHYIAELFRYDARGMTVGLLEPAGGEWSFAYDATWRLFPVRTRDPVGHPTQLTRGEWPFQVVASVDPNGNRTEYVYDPNGLMATRAVMGRFKGGAWQGDPPSAPTEQYEYELATIPMRVVTRTRQVREGPTSDVFRYFDGLGRQVQERRSAEPDAGRQDRPRWRVTGRKLFNHKGLVVRTYQPFFDDTDAYREGAATGPVTRTIYDPLGRVLRIDNPDGTFETTTYDPWVQTAHDRNDNAGHLAAVSRHYGSHLAGINTHLRTPTRIYLDALGREAAVAEDNGSGHVHVTRRAYDLNDRLVAVHDARGLGIPTWTFTYDLAGRQLAQEHPTALGRRLVMTDAVGHVIWSRDARGTETGRTFDPLGRPLSERTRISGRDTLRRAWRYATYDEQDPEFDRLRDRNVFGHVEEERDADGLRFFDYDWRGLVTRASHRFWDQRDNAGRAWNDAGSAFWTDGAAWDPGTPAAARASIASWLNLPHLTDPTTVVVDTNYDAAERPLEVRYPEGLATRATYNEAGTLARLEVARGDGFRTVVDGLTYNARGQLVSLRHGNGVETTRAYDDETERLVAIVTHRPGAAPLHLQDLAFAYDPVGNPVEFTDRLERSRFSHNQLIPNTRTFAYDPRYRLVRATGKRHRSLRAKDGDTLVPSPDPSDYAPYDIAYAYDEVGNLTRNEEYGTQPLHYKAGRGDLFNGDDDEAQSFADPAAGNFRYDANGNTVRTPRHRELAYTDDDQLRYADLNGGGQVRYLRHGDQRVLRFGRKGGLMSLGLYLGSFEYHLREGSSGAVKMVLHAHGHGRHGQVERVLAGSDPTSLATFYVHPDYLGSGQVLTHEDGDLLSQEEFFPYGRPSDRRDSRNRHRFIGVERDGATGFCMTGPRGYDPVTARFLQGDPAAASQTEWTPYCYAAGRPTASRDPSGYQATPISPNARFTLSALKECADTDAAVRGGARAGGLQFTADAVAATPMVVMGLAPTTGLLMLPVYLAAADAISERAKEEFTAAARHGETAAKVAKYAVYIGGLIVSTVVAPESGMGAGVGTMTKGESGAFGKIVNNIFARARVPSKPVVTVVEETAQAAARKFDSNAMMSKIWAEGLPAGAANRIKHITQRYEEIKAAAVAAGQKWGYRPRPQTDGSFVFESGLGTEATIVAKDGTVYRTNTLAWTQEMKDAAEAGSFVLERFAAMFESAFSVLVP
jgi:RHS repeat-associated protein